MNLPNLITTIRITLVLPLVLLLYQQSSKTCQWWALGIFLLAAATDWLDGYIARKWNQVTEVGKFLDPLSDKILVIAPLLVLVERRQIPAWGVFIIVLREMIIAGWRVNPQLKNQQQISGASSWGKIKTVSQIVAISLLLAPLAELHWTGLIFFWISVAFTVVSGILYLLPQSTTVGE
ncbi:MAG: CDP-diacylglycerol--glycerol-3-phosphate 3-phosphatidyltransferase [Geminocystis sp.]|nr:CDP-diacylglycerol--glycerol-3-phosphate 3-phosphatidyltransferase [Geminocystis sp.]HIK37249.1 CDP-diacylglycerol--glycerol-3-phosphate 3-phosphatidyltransferase [Geminocystis sp. M7585_C2015_104]MCS7148206.1 CDP-diacylglycerol--glycerol-3-phosphate 3-phosphatidyltransferase [Geminocystis sp.]MCX8077620.1 CDP-diacylglycerol--glycerol-3-phosphate 3-phosphatidyltransferase [Geminocystis sp.]MDW8117310.1 CDP-diacylglycerol--glycerol-3-phosphate 3-phosphatidyltransferase [Geminocystis sp.]